MAIIKGFAAVALLENNTAGAYSSIGELSNKDKTYSKDVKTYSIDGNIVDTMVFSCKTTLGVPTSITTSEGNNIGRVNEYIVRYGIDNPGTYSKNTLISLLTDEFSTDFDTFVLGDLVNQGTVFAPSWVSFSSTNDQHSVKIWFAREAFSSQYDEYEVIVIPRVSNVSLLNVINMTEFNASLASTPEQYMLTRLSEVTEEFPATSIDINYYTWISREDPSDTYELPFTYVIYGNGVELDALKALTIELLVATTGGIDTVWRQMIPSLFGSNEFILVPHWDKFSIPNASMSSAFYSPVIRDGDTFDYASIVYGVINPSHIEETAITTITSYRGLAITIYPSADNIGGVDRFDETYPDYFPANSSNFPDFSRLSPETQNLIRVLERLTVSAEVLGTGSSLEPGVVTRTIGDKLFAVASTDDGNTFLMLSKSDLVNT